MIYTLGNYEVSIRDERTYSRNSTDNPRAYDYEYIRTEEYEHASAHGVVVTDFESKLSSAIILGVGGATNVSENSLAYDGNNIYVAAGDALFALSIPNLKLLWCCKVDFATCFGVYWLKEQGCLITWGELNVSRLTPDGKQVWSSSGSDIFTESFEILKNQIRVSDFNNDLNSADGNVRKEKKVNYFN